MPVKFYLCIFIAILVNHAKAESYSVYGNSISTYPGYIPSNYNCWYSEKQMFVEDTWWYQVGVSMNWSFCSNSSWSGSRVSYDKSWDYNSYFISSYRIENLSSNEDPDNILILGGVNDWIWSINKLGTVDNEDSTTLCGAYKLMLDRLVKRYPHSKMYCISILPMTYNNQTIYTLNSMGWSIDQANGCIKSICSLKNIAFINMKDCPLSENVSAFTYDGLHPTIQGMKLIADFISDKIKEINLSSVKVLNVEENLYSDTYFNLNGLKALPGEAKSGIFIRKRGYGSFSKVLIK